MNDLQGRLLNFSIEIVGFAKTVKLDSINRPLVTQLIRSATSIGANYTEAQSGFSKKDFRAKTSIAKKESQETLYWLRLLEVVMPKQQSQIAVLARESEEICKILQAILNKSKV